MITPSQLIYPVIFSASEEEEKISPDPDNGLLHTSARRAILLSDSTMREGNFSEGENIGCMGKPRWITRPAA